MSVVFIRRWLVAFFTAVGIIIVVAIFFRKVSVFPWKSEHCHVARNVATIDELVHELHCSFCQIDSIYA